MTLARAIEFRKRMDAETDPDKKRKIFREWEEEITAGAKEKRLLKLFGKAPPSKEIKDNT